MSKTSILSVVLLVAAQQITNLITTIPVAAMTGIFCFTAGHSCGLAIGLAQGSLLNNINSMLC
jgi:hypothetical protein